MKAVVDKLKGWNGTARLIALLLAAVALFLEAKCGLVVNDRWTRQDAEKQILHDERERDEIKLRIRRLEELHLNAKNDKGD